MLEARPYVLPIVGRGPEARLCPCLEKVDGKQLRRFLHRWHGSVQAGGESILLGEKVGQLSRLLGRASDPKLPVYWTCARRKRKPAWYCSRAFGFGLNTYCGL